MSARLGIYDPGRDSCSEPGTFDWGAVVFRERLETRVAVGDLTLGRMKNTLRFVHSFTAFVYQPQDGPPVRLGAIKIADGKQVLFTTWLTANLDRWPSGSYREDAKTAILGWLKELEDEELIERSPFHRPRKLKFPKTHHRAMRKPNYRAVMREARRHRGARPFRSIFFASWHAGVRLIEFRRLEPHEIDWQASVIRIPPNKHKTGKKTAEERIVGIGPHLVKVLRALVEKMRPGQKYVFLSPRGQPWTKDNLGRHYSRYRRLAGVHPSIKMCAVRHGFAVRSILAGEDAKAVADALGHKGTRMIESIYAAETRYDAERVREVAARAERSRKKKPPQERPKSKPRPDTPLFDGLE